MKMKRKLGSTVASGLMVVGLIAPMAAAVTSKVGGGEWTYGITYEGRGRDRKQSTVYSYYYHRNVLHRASTMNGFKEYSCHASRAGQTARTSQRADPDSTDHAYWSKYEWCP